MLLLTFDMSKTVKKIPTTLISCFIEKGNFYELFFPPKTLISCHVNWLKILKIIQCLVVLIRNKVD